MKKKLLICALGIFASVLVTCIFNSNTASAGTIGTGQKCTVFSYSSSTTPKKYCAHYLYVTHNDVKTACPKGGTKSTCETKVKNHLTGNWASGMSDSVQQSYLNNYAADIADIMITTDVDYCSSVYSAGQTSCMCSSSWKDFYYENGTCTTVTPAPSDGGDDDDDGDDGTTGGDGTIADVATGSCASILKNFCFDDGTVDIGGLIGMIITILTGTVVVAGTVGVIICGFLWMSARDNEGQVAQAKKRMLDIVIGIIAWVLLALLANLFIPKSTSDIENNVGGDTGLGVITAPVTPPSSGGGSTGDDPSTPTTPGDGSWNRLCGPDPSVAIDKSVYGQRTTLYTNKFGRTFYRYQQSDELWSGLPAGTNSEGNQGTLYSRGCYRTSIAVMFNSFGLTDFTPAKLSTESGGMDIDLAMSKYPKSKDYMTATYYSSGKSSWKTKIINAISGGGGVIFLIEKKDGVENDFTSSMHKMPAIDYDSSNGKVFISNTISTKSGWYDLDYLLTSDKVNVTGIVIVMPKDSSLKCKN